MKTLRPYLIWFAVAVLLTIGAIFAMRWARDHPEHFSGARFELAHPQGWATHGKLVALAGDDAACFAASTAPTPAICGGRRSATGYAARASA